MADHNSALYYASNHEVLLVAAGGVVVAGGEYTSEISADDIEAVLQ